MDHPGPTSQRPLAGSEFCPLTNKPALCRSSVPFPQLKPRLVKSLYFHSCVFRWQFILKPKDSQQQRCQRSRFNHESCDIWCFSQSPAPCSHVITCKSPLSTKSLALVVEEKLENVTQVPPEGSTAIRQKKNNLACSGCLNLLIFRGPTHDR